MHEFGGQWTEKKLDRIRKYLEAYMKIFTKNEKASYYTTTYIDAFAGSGYRSDCDSRLEDGLFENDVDANILMKGSAQIALDIEPSFERYIFIEKDPRFTEELTNVIEKYSHLVNRIIIEKGDANEKLIQWANNIDPKKDRAVVFLDPYGMQVDWATISALGATKAVDLWILFPLGQGVNRLLTRGQLPPENWSNKLTKIFGTEDWKNIFYKKSKQVDLFTTEQEYYKDTDFEAIGSFFNSRLREVFAAVAPNPFPLRNSRNNPIFLLCFAAANLKGSRTAVKIANDLLRQ